MHADLIVVLVDGEIVERGTHEELMATSGRYRAMVELQTGPVIQLPHNGNGHPGVSHQSLGACEAKIWLRLGRRWLRAGVGIGRFGSGGVVLLQMSSFNLSQAHSMPRVMSCI